MLVYFLLMFALSLAVAWATRMPYAYAVTQAFTASSNKCVRPGGGGEGKGGGATADHRVRFAAVCC
jgi:hypothetical protein